MSAHMDLGLVTTIADDDDISVASESSDSELEVGYEQMNVMEKSRSQIRWCYKCSRNCH